MIEDNLLIENAKSGDTVAFGELVRRYQIDVRTFLRSRINDPATADDLAQEVFLGAMKTIDRLQQHSSVRSWLIMIARYKLVDFFRTESRRRQLTNELELALDTESIRRIQDDDFVNNENVLKSLRTCIASLKPEARQLITKYYFDNTSATQIANDAMENPGTIRMMLLRIRRALAKCIRKRMAGAVKP